MSAQSVVIRLGNVRLSVEGNLPTPVADEIRKTLSYVVPGHEFMPRYKQDQMLAAMTGKTPWDGTKTVTRWKTGKLSAPTGLFSYVREILKNNNVEYRILDERPQPVITTGWSTGDLKLRDYQVVPVEEGLSRQRGVIQAGTGCHALGQRILMFDGSMKRVEEVRVGDLLMGPDSHPRKVVSLIRGKGKMYKVVPVKGEPFVVNEDHVLSLVRTNTTSNAPKKEYASRSKRGEVVDESLKDWLKWSKKRKHKYKLFRAAVNFRKKDLPLDPYLIGALLGDGAITQCVQLVVANKDPEIGEAFKSIAAKYDTRIVVSEEKYSVRVFRASNGRGKRNIIRERLAKLGLLGMNCEKKFIPQVYKTSSMEDRLSLLAGLMDTDGSRSRNCFDYVSKSKSLSYDVAYVARSCGLAAYVKGCTKKNQFGYEGTYYRVSISGHTSTIPCKVKRKMADKRTQKKNVLRTGFSVFSVGEDRFYGFEIDRDGRYLLDDFTVTHNSGKLEMGVATTVKASVFPAIFYVTSCDLLLQARDRFAKYVRKNGQEVPIGIVGGGQFDLQPITVATVQTAERSLSGLFTKFDEISSDDKQSLDNKQKTDFNDFIRSSQLVILDECHHCSCDTIQTIMNNSHAARYRFGLSASPWRDDGLDILIEAAFGRKICEISSSFLIDEGYLVPPRIIFNHFRQALGPAGNFNAHYTKYVVENEVRNRFIAEKAIEYSQKKNLPTIILVKWAKHAQILAKLIGDCEVLTSSGKAKKVPKKRKLVLDKMRSREVKCIIATTLLDEGVDVPSASVGIFAGGGKSSTRALQRVGRFIRPDPIDPTKQEAIIEEFYDHTRWLGHHAKLRKKILMTEPNFVIEDNSDTLKL